MWPRRGEDTHQIDPVGIHPAQGAPAQISVIVFGICVHAAGVIARDTAEESDGKLGLSMGPCLRDRGAAAPTFHKLSLRTSPLAHAAQGLRGLGIHAAFSMEQERG